MHRLVPVLWFVLAWCPTVAAQGSDAGLIVHVVDHGTKRPLEGVRIAVVGTRRSSLSDSLGVAIIRNPPPRVRLVDVSRIGYQPERFQAELRSGTASRSPTTSPPRSPSARKT